jgi:hypothetical protein
LNELPELVIITAHWQRHQLERLFWNGHGWYSGCCGVAAAVTMKTFSAPNATEACVSPFNLVYNVAGKKQAINRVKLGSATQQSLCSTILCQNACSALYDIVNGSKENTGY